MTTAQYDGRIVSICSKELARLRLAEKQRDELLAENASLQAKLEEADSLAKLAACLNKEFATRMHECKERFTHHKDCMRSLAYRKNGWPCSCEAIAKAGGV